MKAIAQIIDDPLFARVFMVVWGIPVVLAVFVAAQYLPRPAGFARLAMVSAMGCFGIFLVWTGAFGSEKSAEDAWKRLKGSGPISLLPLIFFAAPALLITLAIRAWLKWRRPAR